MTTKAIVCDRVIVTKGGVERDYTLEDFLKQPLTDRVQLVLEGAVRFLAGDVEIDSRVALAALRKTRVTETA
jgi:hypothetical protein